MLTRRTTLAVGAAVLGLTATIYHLVGLYAGGALMATAAFSRSLASERA